MSALPTGAVTFLFTDIEGSTGLLAARPERYRAARARHDTIIRQAVTAHGGVIFQTHGEGFWAAFSSPSEATRAALEAQHTLWHEPWDDASPIKVRMGLHTSEIECHDGEYSGAPLLRCARLMESAHGGQIVISAAATALVGDILSPGSGLKDLGEHRLRDIARPERIYQLTADGLPTDFPPPRTLDTAPNNLPLQVTAFIGREHQIQAVRALLLRPDTRLVTLTGPGGTGKTRLALQVVGDLLDSFPDGVYLVPLASIVDLELVPLAIAQALDVREAAGRSIVSSLADTLRQKRLLLVLDNFEQVVEAASCVADLLNAASRLTILVTSRAVLRLYGEREYPVPPLALPDRRVAPTATHLARFEAVRLFVDRAQAARPDFSVTDENAADVVEICQRLDGLPLAIELAAARIRALPPQALRQRMERRLPLLTGGARDLPARQRTLRDAIAWSYDLLEPDEQVLFRRLAVFRGFTLGAVETVCIGEPPRPGATSVALPPLNLDALDGVESLIEKSLLRREEASDIRPRYLMLETVREFALERLEESGEAHVIRRRHALAALSMAESSEPALYGSEQASWLAHLEQEHDNLRGALRWCEEQGYAEPALRLAVALWSFWAAHGHVKEGRERLETLLARFPPRPSSSRAALGARACFAAATLASIQGDQTRARALHEEGLSLRRAIGDRMGLLASLEGLGVVAGFQGDHAVARRCLEEALAIARDQDDRFAEASVMSNLGNLAYDAGELAVARTCYETVNTLLHELGNPDGGVGSDLALALIAHDLGDYADAEAVASRALARYRQLGHRRLEALALAALGGIALERRERAAAREHLCASITICQTLGDVASSAQVLDRFVDLAAVYGWHERALRLAGSATVLRERAGAPRSRTGQAKLDRVLELAHHAMGDEAADAAWQSGRVLELDDAIAVALSIAEPVSPPGDPLAAPVTVPDVGTASALTRREQEVAVLIARGLTNRQIAEALVITEGTAANHVLHILNKLGYGSRAQVAVWAVEHGLAVTPPQS